LVFFWHAWNCRARRMGHHGAADAARPGMPTAITGAVWRSISEVSSAEEHDDGRHPRRVGLKIALRGQDQDCRRRDQEQIVAGSGRRPDIRLPFAVPAAVVAPPPSPTTSPSKSDRPLYFWCPARPGTPLSAVGG